MIKIKFQRRIRFIEGDYLLGRKIANDEFITADWLMNKSLTYCDLTFVFMEFHEGFVLDEIIDNHTDSVVYLKDLNEHAKAAYESSLRSLAKQRLEAIAV